MKSVQLSISGFVKNYFTLEFQRNGFNPAFVYYSLLFSVDARLKISSTFTTVKTATLLP